MAVDQVEQLFRTPESGAPAGSAAAVPSTTSASRTGQPDDAMETAYLLDSVSRESEETDVEGESRVFVLLLTFLQWAVFAAAIAAALALMWFVGKGTYLP